VEGISGKRIVLIGGAGFIGHHLALTLKSCGAEVWILDSLQVNNLGAFLSASANYPNKQLYIEMLTERLSLLSNAQIPVYTIDARQYHELGIQLSKIKPHIMVQLAAVSHAGTSNKDPYSTFDHSLRTLENALDCARGAVERFVFFSSSMVYGDFPAEKVTEETSCEPLGIYGALKYAGEKIVIAYNQVFDLPYTIVRPSALYGERCVSRRVGQVFIESALGGVDLVVNGDGQDRLDFTYIADLVQGIMLAIAKKEGENQIFNLTYGESRSTIDLIQILKEKIPNIKISYQARDKLVPKRGTLSVDKARELLGYNPNYPIEEGFVKYISWYQDFSKSRSRITNTKILELESETAIVLPVTCVPL
jgi:nucleoside-diphosphate-sugar epimerase